MLARARMTATAAHVDVALVGGGIVGLATALAITAARPGISLTLFEKEPALGAHQT